MKRKEKLKKEKVVKYYKYQRELDDFSKSIKSYYRERLTFEKIYDIYELEYDNFKDYYLYTDTEEKLNFGIDSPFDGCFDDITIEHIRKLKLERLNNV